MGRLRSVEQFFFRNPTPLSVRHLPAPGIAGVVSAWEGTPPGIGKGWLEPAVAGLQGLPRAQARIALLAAMAAWAVDDGEVSEFRRAGGGDRALLDSAAWGSYLAAERIASWLQAPA